MTQFHVSNVIKLNLDFIDIFTWLGRQKLDFFLKSCKFSIFCGFNRITQKATGQFCWNTYFFNPWNALFLREKVSSFGHCKLFLTPSRQVWETMTRTEEDLLNTQVWTIHIISYYIFTDWTYYITLTLTHLQTIENCIVCKNNWVAYHKLFI